MNVKTNPLTLDPTRTITLRRGFARSLSTAFTVLRREIVSLVVGEDAFGLKDSFPPFVANRRWKYATQSQATELFEEWMTKLVDASLLSPSEVTKWQAYIKRGFDRGAARAFDDTSKVRKKQALDNLRGVGFVEGRREQFIRQTLARATAAEKLKLLQQRALTEVKGMCDDVKAKAKRVLTDGLVSGVQPTEIAVRLSKQLKISLGRAQTIAYTELVRAHADGQLEAMEQLGVTEVGVAVEWSTTATPCKLCQPMKGVVLKISEARGLIPRHPRCFVNPKVAIYTADGWKPLGEIRVDDLVLTHKGRFRKVLQLHRNKSRGKKVVTFRIGYGGTQHIITMTDEHPVMVDGEWVESKHLKVGDKIRWMSQKCLGCTKPLPFGLKYCNQKCQWKNPEHKENIRDKSRTARLKEYADGSRDANMIARAANAKVAEMRQEGAYKERDISGDKNPGKTLQARMKNVLSKLGPNNPMRKNPLSGMTNGKTLVTFIRNNPEKHANYICAQKGHRTGIEKKMEVALKSAGIVAVFNHPCMNKWIDFAIVDHKIAIECDGAYWHKNKDKDSTRDQVLESDGWTVLRFSEEEINTNVRGCIDKIQRVLKNHNGEYEFSDFEVVEVSSKIIGNTTLYNLSVEEDESYIAKGCVVHNCMCAFQPANVGEDKTEKGMQKRGKYKIDKAVQQSKKRQGEGATEWGPTKPIDKTRPKPLINVECTCSTADIVFSNLLKQIGVN